jgi:hypothetical protein
MTEQRSNQLYSANTGTATTDAFITILQAFPPSQQDINYPIGKRWVDTTSNVDYILANLFVQNGVVLANWISLASGGPGTTEKLKGNSGGAVGPDGSSVINVVGDASTINIVGNPSTNTLTANVILPSSDYSVLVGEVSSINGVAPGTTGQFLQTNGPGQLPSWETIPSGPGGTIWQSVNAPTVQTQAGYGYFVTSNSILDLPLSPSNGDTVSVISKFPTQSAYIFINTSNKDINAGVVSGTAGAASTQIGDSIVLVYDATSQSWNALSMIGCWTIS